jgi:hypothetical protein
MECLHKHTKGFDHHWPSRFRQRGQQPGKLSLARPGQLRSNMLAGIGQMEFECATVVRTARTHNPTLAFEHTYEPAHSALFEPKPLRERVLCEQATMTQFQERVRFGYRDWFAARRLLGPVQPKGADKCNDLLL